MGMPSARIRFFRKAKGMTQKRLAELMGVTPTTVYLWERGDRTPPYERLVLIAKHLEVPRNLFFAESLDELGAEEQAG